MSDDETFSLGLPVWASALLFGLVVPVVAGTLAWLTVQWMPIPQPPGAETDTEPMVLLEEPGSPSPADLSREDGR